MSVIIKKVVCIRKLGFERNSTHASSMHLHMMVQALTTIDGRSSSVVWWDMKKLRSIYPLYHSLPSLPIECAGLVCRSRCSARPKARMEATTSPDLKNGGCHAETRDEDPPIKDYHTRTYRGHRSRA